MVEPPKPSPFRGADDADLIAALGKPGCEDASSGNAAYPVQPFFMRRVFAVNQLRSVWICWLLGVIPTGAGHEGRGSDGSRDRLSPIRYHFLWPMRRERHLERGCL